jgi:hypothetical protein
VYPTTSATTIATSLRVIGFGFTVPPAPARRLWLRNPGLAQTGDKIGLVLLQKDRIV